MGYRYRDTDVAGAFENRRNRRNGDVAGAFDNNNPRVRVYGYINEEDLCRAVRRCLDDLVAGVEDNRDCDCHRRRRR